MQPTTITIPFNQYRFYFETEQPIRLPAFPGSAWRGAFGHALKKTVCVVRNTPCAQCLLKNACAYSVVFETPPPPGSEKMRKYNAAPHPFVLQFPRQIDGDTVYALDMILFGHAERYFPYIVHALQKAGLDGIGGNRQRFELQRIDYLDPMDNEQTVYRQGQLQPRPPPSMPKIPGLPEWITIEMRTPLRIKHDGKNLTPDHFNFGAFFANLLRRQSMLSYFHTDTPHETDFAELNRQAANIQSIETRLHWHDWTRYSSRQQTEMNMGGLLGRFSLDMRGNEAFWPYLWLGQWTHAGKATSMGLGAYTITPTSLPDKEKSTKSSSIK